LPDRVVSPEVEVLVVIPGDTHDVEIAVAIKVHGLRPEVALLAGADEVRRPFPPAVDVLPDDGAEPVSAMFARYDVEVAVPVEVRDVE
jgi:hypothetical protein